MELSEMIMACQTAVGATPDGIAGPDTWLKIYGKLVGPAPPVPVPTYVLFADGNHNDPWPPPPGIPAFIHKASEGTWFRDPNGAARRTQFKAGGGKWGWYHFTSGEDPAAQAAHFLAAVASMGVDNTDLICLDFEESSRSGDSNMTAAGAQQWIDIVEAQLGGKVCVYGSDLLTGALSDNPNAFLGRPLWPAWYHTSPPILPGNRQWGIWQFTGNGQPYADMDRYPGTLDQLQANWPQLRT